MKTKLKDIVDIRTGYQFRGKVEPTTEASGIPFIQIKDVGPDFGLDPSDVYCVNVDIKTSRDKVIEKYGVETGDVLFLSRGAQLFATAVEPEIHTINDFNRNSPRFTKARISKRYLDLFFRI